MAKQKPISDEQEFRTCLSRLKQLGVAVGPIADLSPEPERIILKQTDPGFARLYEFASREIAIVIPVEITVLTSGVLIIDRELTLILDDFPLDFTDPEWTNYQRVVEEYPCSSKNLNYMLTGSRPLRPCQERGIIIANGWNRIPAQYHDNEGLKARLFLMDERQNEISYEFVVKLDRSFKISYERKMARMRASQPSNERGRRVSEVRDLLSGANKAAEQTQEHIDDERQGAELKRRIC